MARNLNELHPRLQEKIARLQVLCAKKGLQLGIGNASDQRANKMHYMLRDEQNPVQSSQKHPVPVIAASTNGGLHSISSKI